MTQWVARGKIELHGVDFFIEAETKEEAIAMANAGDFQFYEDHGAQPMNWIIEPDSVKPDDIHNPE